MFLASFADRLTKAWFAVLAITLFTLSVGCSKQRLAKSPMSRFTELSQADRTRLGQQREIVATALRQRYGAVALTGSVNDLPVLQRLIDDGVFSKTQTYELQCLGVAFGDVLVSELPLRWVMITDEYGTDPTLRFRSTAVQINALTMISKRVEKDEKPDLQGLLRQTREQLARLPEDGTS